jgi:hypothetical protein
MVVTLDLTGSYDRLHCSFLLPLGRQPDEQAQGKDTVQVSATVMWRMKGVGCLPTLLDRIGTVPGNGKRSTPRWSRRPSGFSEHFFASCPLEQGREVG